MTDGINFVTTDARGDYRIVTLADSRFVYITTPSGYDVPTERGTVPQFYKTLNATDSVYNFSLTRAKKSDKRHSFLVFADVQATYEGDYEQFNRDIIPDVKATIADYGKRGVKLFGTDVGDFIVKARKAVKDRNPDLRFGVYVGAWYSTYYEYGVNWASPNYNAAADFSRWASEEWNRAGYADQLDYLLLGAYAGANSIYGTTEWTCQGFCQKAQKYIAGAVKFAGGPDVGNGTGFENGGQGNAVRQSVDACINASDGYFLFDMVHVRQYGYSNYVKMGIDDYLKTLK